MQPPNSASSHLVSGPDRNRADDVFVWTEGPVELLSSAAFAVRTTAARGGSSPRMTPDGRFVLFRPRLRRASAGFVSLRRRIRAALRPPENVQFPPRHPKEDLMAKGNNARKKETKKPKKDAKVAADKPKDPKKK
jgi:hypothetical protein